MERIEAALRESEARYRRLAENAPDIIFRYEYLPERRWEFYVGQAMQRILGYPPEAFYANPDMLLHIVHPADLATQMLLVVRDREQVERSTLRYLHADGRTLWMEVNRTFIWNEQGQIVAYGGTARDVSEIKHRESVQLLLFDVDRQILQDEPLDAILHAACERLVGAFDVALACVGIKQPDGSLTIQAAACCDRLHRRYAHALG